MYSIKPDTLSSHETKVLLYIRNDSEMFRGRSTALVRLLPHMLVWCPSSFSRSLVTASLKDRKLWLSVKFTKLFTHRDYLSPTRKKR